MNSPYPDEDDDDYILRERTDHDYSKASRGRWSKAMQEGSNIVLIEDDLLAMFPNQEAVNAALRGLKQLAERAAQAKAA